MERFLSEGSRATNTDDDETLAGGIWSRTIPLYETSRQREIYDEQANLYAIIMATEHLERAFARDAISQQEYTQQCKKLISQFKLAERAALDTTSNSSSGGGSSGNAGTNNINTTTETFMAMYQMDCPRAAERLLRMGIPEPMKGTAEDINHAATVAETVQYFITTMDAVKLEQRYVDELQPLLSDLMDSLTRLSETPDDFEPNRKVEKWLKKLNAMRAIDQIEEEDSRQLYHDLDSAYTEFTRYLKRGS